MADANLVHDEDQLMVFRDAIIIRRKFYALMSLFAQDLWFYSSAPCGIF